MITGSVYIPLTVEPGDDITRDRRKLAILGECPDGAHVIVDFGRRKFVTHDAAVWLHEHDHRLAIEIRAEDPAAVARFVAAARAGDWAVGA